MNEPKETTPKDPPKEPTATASLMEIAGLTPQSIIRTETVLSKMPIHNLSKKGSINISIVQKGTNGKVELSWQVSPNRNYGEPRQLAYKVDTLIVNRRIEEEGRPLPPVIALGSIRQICRDLGINEGKGSNDVKRALLQNSSAYISAKLTYKGNDRAERRLDANFTRYSVVFTGEKLPDGRAADGVYLILNDPYREVLNNAPVRPLNYDYLKGLPPTHQRFYELVSYRIYAALKFRRDEAKMAYSEYCTYSAQQRYPDYDRFKKQMYKVHRPHLASGYLKSIRFQTTLDEEGKPDWSMLYVPGPKARAEFNAFTNTGRLPDGAFEAPGSDPDPAPPRIGRAKPRRPAQRQAAFRFAPAPADGAAPEPDPLLAALTKRGIAEAKARELIRAADPDTLIDQLEWGDHLVAAARTPIANPPGFYIHLLAAGTVPPATFETSRRRAARERQQAEHGREAELLLAREAAYDAYRREAVDRHIADHVRPDDFAALVREKAADHRRWFRNLPPETVAEIADRGARSAIAERLALPTFAEFCAGLDCAERRES